MKIRNFIVALSLLCTTGTAGRAQANSDALGALLGAAILSGAIVGVHKTGYEIWLKRELGDWKDVNTDTTVAMASQCDINMETRLIGDRKRNYIFLVLENQSDTPVVIKAEDITISFSEGRTRHPEFLTKPEDKEIRPNWSAFILIPLPKKWDFKDQKSLEVTIPVLDQSGKNKVCTVTTTSKRNSAQKQLLTTYVNSSVLDMSVEFGSVLAPIGDSKNLRNIGNLYFGFDFGFYWNPAHGFRMGFGVGDLNSDLNKKASANMGYAVDVRASDLYLAYSYKYFSTFKKSYRYDLGLSITSYINEKIPYPEASRELGTGTGFFQKLTYLYRIAYISRGFWAGDYHVGTNIAHKFYSDHTVGHVPVGGHTLSGGVTFVLGI